MSQLAELQFISVIGSPFIPKNPYLPRLGLHLYQAGWARARLALSLAFKNQSRPKYCSAQPNPIQPGHEHLYKEAYFVLSWLTLARRNRPGGGESLYSLLIAQWILDGNSIFLSTYDTAGLRDGVGVHVSVGGKYLPKN